MSQGPVRWVAITAGAVDARRDTVAGLAVGGYYVRARAVRGGAAALWRVRTRDLGGISVAAYNDVRGPQHGLSVGVVNRARSLRGVQLGLLNHVSDNPPLLRWMPVANVRFGR
ncbi:MAG TPA: hypothetical protein VNA89_05255 [Gemmatimonadaceae bacterium]|nr:hypothetical protein [Gemmatimonadaceae bacterium]